MLIFSSPTWWSVTVKVLSNNAFSSFYLLPPHFLAVWSNTVICTHVMLPAVSVPAAPVGVLTVSPTVITFQCSYPLSVIYTSFRYSALRALHYSSSGVLGHSTLLYTSSSSLLFSTFRVLFCFTLRVLSFIGLRYVPLCCSMLTTLHSPPHVSVMYYSVFPMLHNASYPSLRFLHALPSALSTCATHCAIYMRYRLPTALSTCAIYCAIYMRCPLRYLHVLLRSLHALSTTLSACVTCFVIYMRYLHALPTALSTYAAFCATYMCYLLRYLLRYLHTLSMCAIFMRYLRALSACALYFIYK